MASLERHNVEMNQEQTAVNFTMNDSSLQDVYTLQIRRQVNPNSGSPYCEACKNGFLHVNSLQVRQFTQTGKLPGVCKSCNIAFLKICRLQIRHLTQTESHPHVCEQCHKGFTHAGNYKKHKLLHEKAAAEKGNENGALDSRPKPPYACEKCDRNFLKYASFLKHCQKHDVVKQFVCDICDKVYKTKPLLKSHMLRHKVDEIRTLACKLCKEVFLRPEELEEHLLKHVEDQAQSVKQEAGEGQVEVKTEDGKVENDNDKFKHYCSICQKGFINLGALKNHFSLHTGNLAYECKRCKRRFMHAFNLKKHAQTHLKNRYCCKACNRVFKSLKPFKKHSKIHKVKISPTKKRGRPAKNKSKK